MEQILSTPAEKQRTILITCFFGLVARDILYTKVLDILKSRYDLRVVILVPQKKKSLFSDEFSGENVIVEGVPDIPLTWGEKIFAGLFLNLLNTSTRSVQRLVKFKKSKNYLEYCGCGLLALLGSSSAVVKLARFLGNIVQLPQFFSQYFTKYKPELLFSTDIMVRDDVRIMRTARAGGVPMVGMVRSWDNLTLYGILPVIPGKIIVQNTPIKNELLRYQFLPDRHIFVVGIPHYDEYVKNPSTDRKEFFKEMKMDPAKRVVMFTPGAVKHWGDEELNIKIMETLSHFDVNVLARLPIMGDVNLVGFDVPGNVILDKPVRTKESVDAVLNKEADQHLADSLSHSDVVVTGPSTIIVDAVVLGKPVVYVNFDWNEMPYWKSAKRFVDYNHIRTILGTGAVRIANDLKELEKFVGQYLENPSLDDDKRRELALQKRYNLDGKSSERLASVILNALED